MSTVGKINSQLDGFANEETMFFIYVNELASQIEAFNMQRHSSVVNILVTANCSKHFCKLDLG